MFGVEVGARSTRKGAKLHPATGCQYASLPLIGETETLTTANADDVCRSAACRKAIRTALDTAQDVNRTRTACNHRIKIEKIETEGRLTALVELFRSPAEIAYEVELLSRVAEPVEVETVPEPVLSKFERAAVNAGYVPRQTERVVTRPSANRRLKLARSFATTTKAA